MAVDVGYSGESVGVASVHERNTYQVGRRRKGICQLNGPCTENPRSRHCVKQRGVNSDGWKVNVTQRDDRGRAMTGVEGNSVNKVPRLAWRDLWINPHSVA